MSGIKIFVKDEDDKKKLIESYLAEDDCYLRALENLRNDLISQGIDITKGEGRKTYILAVRKLNEGYMNPDSP